MGQGQGSILNQQKRRQSGAPFAATAADNGLSVDPVSGRIVLGNDPGAIGSPAALLSAREIIDGVGLGVVFMDPGGTISSRIAASRIDVDDNIAFGQTHLENSFAGGALLGLGAGNPLATARIAMGNGLNVNIISDTGVLHIDDNGGNRMLNLDSVGGIFQLGSGTSGNATNERITDAAGSHDVTNSGLNAIYSINGIPGVNGIITAANVATVVGGIITQIV